MPHGTLQQRSLLDRVNRYAQSSATPSCGIATTGHQRENTLGEFEPTAAQWSSGRGENGSPSRRGRAQRVPLWAPRGPGRRCAGRATSKLQIVGPHVSWLNRSMPRRERPMPAQGPRQHRPKGGCVQYGAGGDAFERWLSPVSPHVVCRRTEGSSSSTGRCTRLASRGPATPRLLPSDHPCCSSPSTLSGQTTSARTATAAAAAVLDAEQRFRRIRGYREMPRMRAPTSTASRTMASSSNGMLQAHPGPRRLT